MFRVCLPHPGESETDIFTKDCQAIGRFIYTLVGEYINTMNTTFI